MTYTVEEIAAIIKVQAATGAKQEISVLLTDSRSLTFPERTMFFALETRNNDGHRYMRDLYDRGVRNFVARYVPDDMKDENGKAYAYRDSAGNYYELGFGLRYC